MAKRKAESSAGNNPKRLGPPPSERESARRQPVKCPPAVQLRQQSDGNWAFVPPRCAKEREADLQEVEAMIEAGEIEIAREELQWLLQDCPENIAVHELLGEIALYESDLPLARGHFGFAWQLAQRAIAAAGNPAPIPFTLPDNQPFFAAGKGLVHVLQALEMRDRALEVFELLQASDPTDPLGVREVLFPSPDSAAGGSACGANAGPQIVELRIFPRVEKGGEGA
ncbi:MAG: hypothetical protein SGJ20_08385 [Planctomycetota bacterium]|nr:hypothetical protein [Planctomycetota bacterium]